VRPYADVCLGFSISFVDCDPGWHPWSWWWWRSPRRAYCGPRYVCHATEHYCSHGHGKGHDNWCDNGGPTYPSEYKWKSRHESAGRPPAEDTSRRVVSRSGNVIDATRYKSTERDVDGRAGRDLEPQRESTTGDVRTRVRADDRGSDDVKTDRDIRVREEKREEIKAGEPKGERTKSKSGTSIVKAALSSISRSITRSGKSSTDNTPKGKTPQVRQQGDKGKSQATRRKLSR
jgi:hypothetical protein